MYSLAYVSDEEVAFDDASLRVLGERCSERNYANAITGYLSWQGGSFFQFLEGEEEAVRELMRSIIDDDRHAVGRIAELCLWEARLFADWDMCFLDPPPPAESRIQAEVERVMRTLWAPELAGKEDTRLIGGMIERVAALVREGDPVEG